MYTESLKNKTFIYSNTKDNIKLASEYQKRLIKEQQKRASAGITMSNDPRKSSSSKKSSSSSKPTTLTAPRIISSSVVGNTITDYYSDGTSRTVQTTGKVGSASPKETAKLTPIRTSQGVIQGKVYSNLTQTEILRNQLSPYTQAKLLPSQTAARRNYVASYSRLQQGKGTSRDLLMVQSGGKGKVENILSKPQQAYNLYNINETKRYANEVYNVLSPNEKKLANSKTGKNKIDYLLKRGRELSKSNNLSDKSFKVFSRLNEPIIRTKAPEFRKTKKISKISNIISSKLEDWGSSIEKRSNQAEKNQARREAKIISNAIAREELVSNYVPKGFKNLGRLFNSLTKLGEKTFIGTIGYGEQLASAGEKAIFLLPALGQSISRGDIKRFSAEFVTQDKKQLLKDIYSNPRTYRDALIGAGVMTILGGVKSGRLTAKEVKNIPRSTRSYSKGTILRDAKGNIGYVSGSGIVKPVPKGFRTITRSLTRNIREFNFRRVKVFPKSSNAKVGTIYRNLRGEIRVVTKGGKVVKVKPSEARLIQKGFIKGRLTRSKRTEKARAISKAKSEAIKTSKISLKTSKILKNRAKEIKLVQIKKEINTFVKRFNVKDARKQEFSKAYKNYRLNPTDKNSGILKKISDKIEIDRGVRFIDNIIKKDLSRSKIKSLKSSRKLKLKDDLITRKIDARRFLKENKIKIKVVSENEMLRIQLQSPTLKAKLIKEASKTGKITLPYGTTDGNTVWILKTKSYKNGWNINKILKHEAIHILKGDVRTIQTSRFPSFKRVILEKRTDLLTRFNYKFPSKTKISQLKSIQIKKGLSKSTTKKVNQLMKKTDLTKKETSFLKKALKKEVKELKLRNKIKSKLAKDIEISSKFQAQIKADRLAQKKGFKDYAEQFKYEKAFRDYQQGSPSAVRTLKSIENKLALRRTTRSRLKAKQIEIQRKRIVQEALKLIKQGKRTLKEQVKPSRLKTKSRLKYSESEIIKLGKEVEARLKFKSNIKPVSQQTVQSNGQQLVTTQKTIPKTRKRRIVVVLKQSQIPKISRATSISSALVVGQTVLNNSNKRLNFAQSRFSSLNQSQQNSLARDLQLNLRQLQYLNTDLNNLKGLGKDLTNTQRNDVVKKSSQVQKQVQKVKQVLRQVLKQIQVYKRLSKRRIKVTKIPILKFKLPKFKKQKISYRKRRKASKKKKKRVYTPTIRGLGRKSSKSYKKRRSFTGTETRGR